MTVDTGSKFGQSPSSGTCAHWSERFINNSTVKVVQVTFAPETAFFSKGKKGSSDYVQTPAKAPEPATLNVSIAPQAAQSLQFMACTDTTPPRLVTPHRQPLGAAVEVGRRRDWHCTLPS